MSAQVHVGDIGTVFQATVKDQDGAVVDISTASVKTLFFRKPNGTVLAKAAVFVATGTDGQMKYVSIAGDLDQSGNWSLQGYVVIGAGQWHTDTATFFVKANVT